VRYAQSPVGRIPTQILMVIASYYVLFAAISDAVQTVLLESVIARLVLAAGDVQHAFPSCALDIPQFF